MAVSVTHYNVEAVMQQCIDTLQGRQRQLGQWKEEADRLERVAEAEAEWDAKMKAKSAARALRYNIAKVEGGEYDEFLLDVLPTYRKYKDTFDRAKKRKKADPASAAAARPPLPTDKKHGSNRGEIFREFIRVVQKYPFLNIMTDAAQVTEDADLYGFCPACNTNMVENSREALLLCSACGLTSEMCNDSERNVPYGTPVCVTDYCYKRINHFNETLAQFHAREKSSIPQDVIDSLSSEFKKARIADTSALTPSIVRKFLRKLRLSKYFEHSVQITHMFNGTPPPTMTQAQEEKLRTMFRLVQDPFEQVVPKGRKNFLNYSYCIHKMCQLLEYDEFLSHFPLLKSKEKLWEQDEIWKNICKKLNWQFIPSK